MQAGPTPKRKATEDANHTPAKTARAASAAPKRATQYPRPKIEQFRHCSMVPFWSRTAVGIKVKQGELTPQVFYLGVRGVSMGVHVDSMREVVAWLSRALPEPLGTALRTLPLTELLRNSAEPS